MGSLRLNMKKIGIARLPPFYSFNKSVNFTNVTASFPDEMTTMGAARKYYFLNCVYFRCEMTRTGNKPLFDVRCGCTRATGWHSGRYPHMLLHQGSILVQGKRPLWASPLIQEILSIGRHSHKAWTWLCDIWHLNSLFRSLRRTLNLKGLIFPRRQHGGDASLNYKWISSHWSIIKAFYWVPKTRRT